MINPTTQRPPPRRRILAIYRRLLATYGEPDRPGLDPVSETVCTILSQNTSDTNRDRAYNRLRERGPWVDIPKHNLTGNMVYEYDTLGRLKTRTQQVGGVTTYNLQLTQARVISVMNALIARLHRAEGGPVVHCHERLGLRLHHRPYRQTVDQL